MIDNFIIQNENTKKSLVIGKDINCDLLLTFVDWSSVSATHNTYNFPNQIGVSISNTKINTRDISIEGYVYYIASKEEKSGLNREEIKNINYQKIKEKKAILNSIINPYDYVKIIIDDYYIIGKPSSSIIYGTTEEENNMYFCKYMINIFCNNPMFKKIESVKTFVEDVTPLFKFPLYIHNGKGLKFGVRNNYLTLEVVNTGSVLTGGIIRIKAKSEISNPYVENNKTRERITINKTLKAGEEIIINTNEGSERSVIGVYKNIEYSYLQYWDFNNEWFMFDVGSNFISYSCDGEKGELLDVSIEIVPQKYSLEEL